MRYVFIFFILAIVGCSAGSKPSHEMKVVYQASKTSFLLGKLEEPYGVVVNQIFDSIGNYNESEIFQRFVNVAFERKDVSGPVSLFKPDFIAGVTDNRMLVDKLESTFKNDFKVTQQMLKQRLAKVAIGEPEIKVIFEDIGVIEIKLKTEESEAYINNLITTKGIFEIWETYESGEIIPLMAKADAELASIIKEDPNVFICPADTAAAEGEYLKHPLAYVLKRNIYYNDTGGEYIPPGACVGKAKLNNVGGIVRYLAQPRVKAIFPINLKFYWGGADDEGFCNLYAIKITQNDGQAPLHGSIAEDARYELDENASEVNYYVEIKMKDTYIPVWRRLTNMNVGKTLAIVLDDMVYSDPMVIGEIPNGLTQITGDLPEGKAKFLCTILKSDPLPLYLSARD